MLRIPFAIILGAVALFANTAQAATLFFVPATGEYGVGKEISIDLKIDSDGVGLNAAQATIRFPKDTLTVKSIDKTGSTFNFWLEEPAFSNEDGVITFVGGTPYGVSGASLQVVHIVFTSKGSGSAPITITDAAVTASDGNGTNILSKTNGAVFTISPTATAPAIIVPAPKQITREVAPASGLPEKPTLTIPLYPDPATWYNLSNIFAVNFALPRNISEISTAINKQPNFTPTEESEGLFDSKTFAALSDGIWYLHVRFQNGIGWGATTHYRIAVDTHPPLPFAVTSDESILSDNPTPVFNFKAGDPISGLSKYQIKIDNGEWLEIPVKNFKGTFKFTLMEPGKHHITVRAVDGAGNSIENGIDHEVLPIPSPTFTFVTDKLYSDEAKGLTIRGTALPLTQILLSIKKGDVITSSATVPVDTNGNWEFTSSEVLLSGTYTANIQNKDTRGALSLIVVSSNIQVTGKYTTIIIITIIALIGALFGGFWFYERRRERTVLRLDVAESDTAKVFKMIETDIEKLNKARGTPTTADDEFITQKLGENVKKMGGYIKEEIKKAKE